MKYFRLFFFLLLALVIVLVEGCDQQLPPVVLTYPITSISASSASCGGNITLDGGANVIARGVCWSTSPNPTIKDAKSIDAAGTGEFKSVVTGLASGTTYYLRAYATNVAGTAYGSQVEFKTLPTFVVSSTLVTDIDGNQYHSIQIGTQQWLVENLKTTHFRDGAIIPDMKNPSMWAAAMGPAMCSYNNTLSTDSINKFGRLYNWFAIHDARGVAPQGWHIATDSEWNTLVLFLVSNGFNYDGSTVSDFTAKSLSAQTDWVISSYPGAIGNDLSKNNLSGFSAYPSGLRSNTGAFLLLGSVTRWWLDMETDSNNSNSKYLQYTLPYLNTSPVQKQFGFSVRCVKD